MKKQFVNTINKPSYVLLATLLKKKLSDYPDKNLPTYREIAEEFGVTIGVVQRAMRLLKEESVVRIRRSVGSERVSSQEARREMFGYGVMKTLDGPLMVSVNNLIRITEEMKLNAVPLVRVSRLEPALERAQAQELAENVLTDGLLISPCNGTENTAFFKEIARKKPVVCIDNQIAGTNLPTVMFDYEQAGHDIGRVFRRLGCKRLLILLSSEYENNSVVDIRRALSKEIPVEEFRIPFRSIQTAARQMDLKPYIEQCVKLEQFIMAHDCDCAFSPYDVMFSYMFTSGVRKSLRTGWPLATICSDEPVLYNEDFISANVMLWQFSDYELLKCAFSRLLNWKKSHSQPRGIQKIQLKRIH